MRLIHARYDSNMEKLEKTMLERISLIYIGKIRPNYLWRRR